VLFRSVLYAQKGAKYTRSADNASLTIKYNELEIPIHFKVKFLQGRIQPYAFLGPNLGLVMSAGSTSEFPGQAPTETDYKSGEQGVNQASTLDFSLEFGGGAEFLLTKQIGLLMNVQYNLGLSNVISPPANQAVVAGQVSPSWKTSGFQILFGCMFHL
jgi:hypothetical protein